MKSIKSHVPGIDWLPISDPTGATLLALTHQLNQSEWLTHMQLKALQFKQLNLLLAHARQSVPYYQTILQSLPPDLHPLALENRWQEIPVLPRSQLQENTNQLTSQSIPKEHGKTYWISSSGSTGRPVRALRNELTQIYYSAIGLRNYFWHNVDLLGKLAEIRFYKDSNFAQPPYGQLRPNWGVIINNIYENGPCSCLSIHSPIKQHRLFSS